MMSNSMKLFKSLKFPGQRKKNVELLLDSGGQIQVRKQTKRLSDHLKSINVASSGDWFFGFDHLCPVSFHQRLAVFQGTSMPWDAHIPAWCKLQHPDDVHPGRQQVMAQILGSLLPICDVVLGSWILSSPTPIIAGIWGMKQRMEGLPLCLSN